MNETSMTTQAGPKRKTQLATLISILTLLLVDPSPIAAQTTPIARLENAHADFQARGEQATPEPWEDGLRISGQRPGEYEWWYFDAQMMDGSVVVGSYNITILPVGPVGTLRASIATSDGQVREQQVALPGLDLSAVSRKQADVTLKSNYFRGNLDTYNIFANSQDLGGIGWDLTLNRVAPSYRPGTGYVSAGDSYFGWFNAVPFGHISGTITYDGHTVTVEGDGYHDHNFGNVAMPTFVEKWWWERMQMGDYTVVASEVNYAHEFGGIVVPQIAIFKGDKLILDGALDPDHLEVIEDDVITHPDPNRGDRPIAKTVIYQYANGDKKINVTFNAGVMIASTNMQTTPLFTTLPADSPLVDNATISPWYTRFVSAGELEVSVPGISDTAQGAGTLERMELR
jgi:CrtC N-terminal lipocalin domain